jgi:6-phospho-beta-glucosidase
MNYTPKMYQGDLEILKRVAGQVDFIAFNYYSSMTVKRPSKVINGQDKKASQQIIADVPFLFDVVANPNLTKTKFG